MKFDCGYMAIAEIGTEAIMSRWSIYKPWVLQSTLLYNCSRSNSSGYSWVWVLILQMINALHDRKVWPHRDARLFSMCTATANGS